MRPQIDHLAYAAPDLDAGMKTIENLLGVAPVRGGQHQGLGTHNALLGLGTGVYLEIIAPDPDQPTPARPRPFGVDTVKEPRLASWIARTSELRRIVESSRASGHDPGEIIALSRRRPDGTLLSWTMAIRDDAPGNGLVPPLIDWGDTPHPSAELPDGGRFVGLRAEHPLPDDIRRILRALQLDLDVSAGPVPTLIATIETERGPVELR